MIKTCKYVALKNYIPQGLPSEDDFEIKTKEIKLNNLIGKKFFIGKVQVEGIDLCRPCRHLTEILKQENILKEFLRKGGLRCKILTSSKINIGDKIKI